MRRLTGIVLAGAFAMTACGGSGSHGNANDGALPASPPASSSPSPTPKPPLTALAVVQGLAKLDQHIKLSITYTARNDPNHLLGRPNGYVSKTAFLDTRINQSQFTHADLGGVDPGGSVEYFSTANLAAHRARYIQSLQAGSPMFGTEYDYLDGGVLLRVSGHLVPSQATKYKRELALVMHHPSTGPVHG